MRPGTTTPTLSGTEVPSGRTGLGDDVVLPDAANDRPVGLWIRALDLADPGWDLEAAAAVLSDGERRRAAQGVPAVRRTRILMRAALRGLVGDVLTTAPAAVPLADASGKPSLEGGVDRWGLDMSSSSSGDVGLVVVARGCMVGVDVERIVEVELSAAVAEGWLAAPERSALADIPAEARSRALTRAWVQKEAVLKGQGKGLRADPARIITPVAEHGRVQGWWVSPLEVPETHVACLALTYAQR